MRRKRFALIEKTISHEFYGHDICIYRYMKSGFGTGLLEISEILTTFIRGLQPGRAGSPS